MTEPLLRKRFQFTDLVANTNKYWQIEVLPDGNTKTEWGRVGVVNEPSIKRGGMNEADKLIREKLRKGYKEVDLHVPDVIVTMNNVPTPAPAMSKNVKHFVDMVFEEAGKQSSSYLSAPIRELSVAQIESAREKVLIANAMLRTKTLIDPAIARSNMLSLAQEYYNLIPTKLPARINAMDVAFDWFANLSTHEQRLDQLEAQLAGYKRTVNQVQGIARLGGVEIEELDSSSAEYAKIHNLIEKTRGYQHHRLRYVVKVCIPQERAAYDTNAYGKSDVQALFHGTHNYNLQFILAGGLICPKTASNGRFYGDGIYFSPQAQKSLNYVHGQTDSRVLLLCNVALGTPKWIGGRGCHNWTETPDGYHSVRSEYTPSGMDEVIVYKNQQVTIQYAAILGA